MNSTSRTLSFLAVAIISSLTAWLAYDSIQPSTVDGYDEVGREFFPEFDDATKATSLTVKAYDDDTREATTFQVRKNDDGVWVIPSHHDYPAEAEERLGRTSTSLLGVKKTAVASRFEDDWKRYGVVDPDADGSADAEQRGTRLTLSDSSDNPLVDLIIGKSVENRSSHYYVRQPDKETTYVTELDVDLSAKFSDWIEPDLLKITSSDIISLTVDNYSIDEQRGAILRKETLDFLKEDMKTSGAWTLTGLDEETEELDKSPVSSIATNLDQLKIVGVRKKPPGLEDDLRVPPQIKKIMMQELQREMQQQGFFVGPDETGEGSRIYGNEGELVAGTDKGVQYTLYFGEIARGSAKDIETGLSSADEKGEDENSADGDDAKSDESDGDSEEEEGPRRYLLVKVDLNEALLGEKPVAPVEPVKPDILKQAEKPDHKDKGGDKADEADKGKADDKGDSKSAGEEKGADNDSEKEKESADTDSSEEKDSEDSGDAAQPNGDSADDSSCEPFDEADSAAKESTDEATAATDDESTPESSQADGEQKAEPADTKAADSTEAADEKSDTQPSDETLADDKKADDTKTEPAKDGDKADATDTKKPADDANAADDKKPEVPIVPEKSPKEIAQEQYDAAMLAYNSAKRTYESDLKSYEEKLEEGREKVDELSRRFSGWYYVISSDSFEKFRVTRNDVVSKKEQDEDKKDGEKSSDDE